MPVHHSYMLEHMMWTGHWFTIHFQEDIKMHAPSPLFFQRLIPIPYLPFLHVPHSTCLWGCASPKARRIYTCRKGNPSGVARRSYVRTKSDGIACATIIFSGSTKVSMVWHVMASQQQTTKCRCSAHMAASLPSPLPILPCMKGRWLTFEGIEGSLAHF